MASQPRASNTSMVPWTKQRMSSDTGAMTRHAKALTPAGHAPRPVSAQAHPPNGMRVTTFQPHPQPRPQTSRPPESELIMSFDPMKDLHLWTMWRVAVNGRIVDETRRRRIVHPPNGPGHDANPYGQALVKRPLDRFIRLGERAHDSARAMQDPEGLKDAHLGTQQFVYYGLPRVVLKKKPKKKLQLP